MKVIFITVFVLASFVSAFGNPFERGECQYCSQNVDYIRGILPQFVEKVCDKYDYRCDENADDVEYAAKITKSLLVHYLRKADTANPPIHIDCLQFYTPSTFNSLLNSYKKRVSTSSICSSWITCANVLSLIFC
uniref:Saposin B-type domain-containing protein n=1 Tax=Panagrellus redivivus TaxID=6233 RepID=A0A7E4WBE6_PANRE